MSLRQSPARWISGVFSSTRFALALWAVLLLGCLLANCWQRLEFSRHRDLRPLGGWDETHYYVWSHSLLLDGDLSFRNEFEFLASLRGISPLSDALRRALDETPSTATGHFPNKYGVGTALLGSPGLLTARGVVLLYGKQHVHPHAMIYTLGHTISLILTSFFGLGAAWFLLRAFGFRPAVCTLAVLFTFFATPLGGYIWFWNTMAHGAGFTLVTLFACVCWGWWGAVERGASRRCWLAWAAGMGALLAVAVMLRYPNAVVALLPVGVVLHGWRVHSGEARTRITAAALQSMVVAGAAAIIAFSPQLLAWKVVYGSYLLNSYQGETMNAYPVHAGRVIAGLRNSLLVWSPILLPATAGLFLTGGRVKGIAVGGGLVLIAFLWVYGSWDCYWLGASFGMRGFVDASFFFMLGLAAVLERGWGSGRWRPRLLAGLMLCAIWTVWLLGATRARVQPMEAPFVGARLISESGPIARRILEDVGAPLNVPSKFYPLLTPLQFTERDSHPLGTSPVNPSGQTIR